MRKIYSALDIGSSYIKLVVGEFLNGKLNILCAVKGESRGFRRNQIVNPDKLVESINRVLDEASTKLNFKISKLVVNIPADYNNFKVSETQIKIENEDGRVATKDILKVLQDSSKDKYDESEELLGCIPVMFQVGDEEVEYPLGKKGKTLSLKSILVTTDKQRVYDLVRLLEKCEVEIVDITTTGLVDYYNFKNRLLDDKNTVVINIGGTTTNISVFGKGIYMNNSSLDMGGEDIDREIATRYNLGKQDAIFLKETLALASPKNADIKEIVTLTTSDNKDITVNQLELSGVVTKRLEEMLKNIKKNINYLTKKEISYIIITGGLAELKDISIPLNKIFGSSVQIGYINDIGARDSGFSTAIGMLKFFNEKLDIRGKEYTMLSEDELDSMTSSGESSLVNSDTLLGKVFSYFFDN